MLSTIAAGVITVAGVAFSVTVATLSLASSQFGPRLPDLDIPSYSALAWRLAALCAGALLLAAAGMAVQRMCRIDRGDRDERGDGRETGEHHGERDEDRDRG